MCHLGCRPSWARSAFLHQGCARDGRHPLRLGSRFFVHETGLARRTGLYKSQGCTNHRVVQITGLYKSQGCTKDRRVQETGLHKKGDLACTARPGLYNETGVQVHVV